MALMAHIVFTIHMQQKYKSVPTVHIVNIKESREVRLEAARWLHGGHLFGRALLGGWLVRVLHLDLGELE